MLAAEQQAQQAADASAARSLEAYQAAQRRADEAARTARTEAAALQAAQVRTEASREALSRYLGSVYRTGVGNRRLSVLNDLIDAEDPQALFSGLSMASRVGGNRNDQLASLRSAEDVRAARPSAPRRRRRPPRPPPPPPRPPRRRPTAPSPTRRPAWPPRPSPSPRPSSAPPQQRRGRPRWRRPRSSRAPGRPSPPVDALLGAAVARPEATCTGASTAGFANGQIPTDVLCPLWGTSGHMLRADAAAAFNALSRAYAEAFRAPICVTDSYRDYPSQVAVRAAKPTLAAVPGTSNHGWGVALDLCDGVQAFGSPQHEWLRSTRWPSAGSTRPGRRPAAPSPSRGTGSTPASSAAPRAGRAGGRQHVPPPVPLHPRAAGPPIARARSGSSSRPATASVTCASDRPSTVTPVSPSRTASGEPPERPATTGSPVALASRKTMPRPSTSRPPRRVRQGIAKTSPAS